jgi:predicted RNase H-like HicB family nuclease
VTVQKALGCFARPFWYTSFIMKNYTFVVEHCPETDLYIGYVPGFSGAHSQGTTLDELQRNMQEVVAMLLEDGEPTLEAEFVGTQTLVMA